jgi:quinoprotein glucose dehydrogenase
MGTGMSSAGRRWCSVLLACCVVGTMSVRHATAQSQSDAVHSTWREYGGAPDGAQYSSLRQIDRTNVGKLQRAWTF